MIYRELCGEKVSLLGFGAMRLPQTAPGFGNPIDREAAIALIRKAYESGVNYFDTAYVYGGGESERIVGEALSIYPRDSYYIATKFPGLHPPKEGWNMENVKATFEEQLQKLGVDYVDFYLLHGLMEMDYHLYSDPNVPLADYFHSLVAEGKIRHFGFSSHATPKLLKEILEWKDYFEFCQIQLNYLDWNLQDAKQQYDILEKAGMPVIVMEPVRGGKLADLGEKGNAMLKAEKPDISVASWAMSFAGSLPAVKVVLSGMNTNEQLEDNIKTFSGELLTETERDFLIHKVVPTMGEFVPCTACCYCTHECPMGLDIPGLIALYNELNLMGRSFHLNDFKGDALPHNCIGCGACQGVCPQAINIPDVMEKLAAKIDDIKAKMAH